MIRQEASELYKQSSSSSNVSQMSQYSEENDWERKQRLMNWFSQNNIQPGFPEEIAQDFFDQAKSKTAKILQENKSIQTNIKLSIPKRNGKLSIFTV